MSARIVLTCDQCGATGPSGKTHAMARLAIRWTNPKPGKDYCPDCSAKRKADDAARNPSGYF